MHFIEIKPPKGYMWSRERQTKIQATARPENVWREVWSKMGKAAQKTDKKEKQEWANEKPKLDIARRLRRIYFIDVGSSHEDGNAWQKRNEEALRLSGNCCKES